MLAQPDPHLLRTLAAIPPHHQVLELGCQAGVHSVPLRQLGFRLTICEADPQALDQARKALEAPGHETSMVLHTAALDTLLPPDTFDWIVSWQPVARPEPWANWARAARRVIKPGGWMYVAMPAASLAASSAGREGPAVLVSHLQQAGWAVAEPPVLIELDERSLVRGIFRRVEADTPL
ncbi:MAG: class I SAM-dependent methyltransferase [Bacteroidota bacterium]